MIIETGFSFVEKTGALASAENPEILVEVRLALKELGKLFSQENPVCLTISLEQ